MVQFAVNPHRLDAYKHFKFRVQWDGRYVAGVSRVSALRRTTDVVVHREGGSPSLQHRSPGITSYEPITLERGRTHDAEFEKWAARVWGLGAEMSLKTFRKDVLIELLNEAGQLAMAFRVYRCWPSEYVALSALDADTSGHAFETLVLQHEGWERDEAIAEPKET